MLQTLEENFYYNWKSVFWHERYIIWRITHFFQKEIRRPSVKYLLWSQLVADWKNYYKFNILLNPMVLLSYAPSRFTQSRYWNQGIAMLKAPDVWKFTWFPWKLSFQLSQRWIYLAQKNQQFLGSPAHSPNVYHDNAIPTNFKPGPKVSPVFWSHGCICSISTNPCFVNRWTHLMTLLFSFFED